MRTYNLSPSSLNLFRECPRCFWLQVNRNIKRPRGPYPSIATGIDGVLKRYFDGYRQKGELPPFLRDKIKGKLASKSLLDALRFSDPENNLIFYGYLDDCVILQDNTYAPLDHKTRATAPNDVHPAYQFQMDCYTFLLEKNNCPTSHKAFLVYYTPSSITAIQEGIKFDLKVMEVKTDLRNAETILYHALQSLKASLPKPEGDCEFCKWASGGLSYIG